MYIEILISLALVLNVFASSEQLLQKVQCAYIEIEKQLSSEISNYSEH